ncbi:MAG: histidine kinase [Bacteroidetes bacterium]|nr:histidine kinase [Bacteroidota bacterium]
MLHAQTETYIDSVLDVVSNTSNDSAKVVIMTFLADRVLQSNKELSRALIDSAKHINAKSGNMFAYLNTRISQGNLFTLEGKMDSSISCFVEVMQYKGKVEFEILVARAQTNLANNYRQQGNLKTALINYLEAEKYYVRTNNMKQLAQIYTNIAGLFFDLNDLKKALDYDFKALEIAKQIGLTLQLSQLYNNVASAYGESNNHDSAMYYYRMALQTAEKFENLDGYIMATQSIGIEYYEMGIIDSALMYLSKAKEIYDRQEYYDESLVVVYEYLGLCELKRKNYNKALHYLTIGDSIATEVGFIIDRIEIKKALKETYAAIGNWQEAYNVQQAYVVLNDSLQRDENIRITRELERKYDTAKKEKENIELQAKNDIQQSQLKSRNRILLATGIAALLLLLLCYFIYRNYQFEKRHSSILDKLNATLITQRDEILHINQLLQLKVLRTQMNPHFIYNCLNAINNLVTKGENEKASNYLVRFARLLRMILDCSDKAFIDLDEEVKFLDLYLSLESMRMGNDFHYFISITKELQDDDISIPSLLVQPFIENAIWHGLLTKEGEKNLHVQFNSVSSNDKIECIVTDNGIGRQRAGELRQLKHGMHHESKGIKITQERIALLSYQIKDDVSVTISDLKDDAQHTSGTRVKLILPVNG